MTSRLPRAAAAMLLGLLLVTIASRSASAHDQFIGSDPAEDANVAEPPTSVTLTFGSAPLELGATVLVVDADGTDHVTGDLAFEANRLVVPIADLAPDAYYQVRWRVVSTDGHVLSGAYAFSVGDQSKATELPALTGTDSATSPNATGTATGQAGPTRLVLIGLAGAAVAVALYLVLPGVLRRRVSPPTNPQEH